MKKEELFTERPALLGVVVLTLICLAPSLLAGPPEVVCVPASGLSPTVPHDTRSGREVTLKGVAHDPDGDHTLATYEWDFGDGSPPESGAVTNPYVIEAKHVYVGSLGDKFIARLTVTDTVGETGLDDYLVEIKDGSDLKVKVNVAIDEGLWRLHKDQVRGTFPDGASYGYWPYGDNPVAATGASTEAFEIQGSLPGGDPSEDPYVETVQRGLNYLLSQLFSIPVSQDPTDCPLGDPDANGNGKGLLSCCHTMYESGISLMALSSSGCPACVATTGPPDVVGRSYLDITQDMVDAFSFCQTEPEPWRGGWRYVCNAGDSDNSVAQWPVIGMESAEVNFGPSGLVVPQFVKDLLNLWIDYIQNDVDGDWADGGSGYRDPWDWVNVAKTGGLLAEMKFVGDAAETPRVQDAVDFIYRNWDDDWEHFPCNSYYAFYSVMKGFRLLGIDTIHRYDEPIEWYREAGEAGKILGGWSGPDEGGELALTLNEDGSFLLLGTVECAPGEASGTYAYDPLSGDLTVEIVDSSFTEPCDIDPGTVEFEVSEISPTEMTWYESFDWYSDPDRGYAQHIVGDQQADGAWNSECWSLHPLTSAWAILTLKKTVVKPGPVADAGPDVPSHPPLIELTFFGTGSYHPDASQSIVQYVWDFGDGSPSVEGAIAQHAFPAVYNPDGTIDWAATTRDYAVTLTAIDDNEPPLSDTDTATVHITPPPWPPVADADGPYTSYPCWLVQLDGSRSYDPNGELYPDPNHPWHGELVSWEWDLDNDGAYDDATGETVSWSDCDLGIHVVGLRVTNSFGEADEVDTLINLVELPPVPIEIPIDIKPTSCPNPVELKNRGALPVAILGTEDFDVAMVDPVTVTLEGVSPLRWDVEDVATPFEPFSGREDAYDCTEEGPDGFLDLSLKFDAQELVAALGDVSDGEVLVLRLSGNLKDEYGGTAFGGEDPVIIRGR